MKGDEKKGGCNFQARVAFFLRARNRPLSLSRFPPENPLAAYVDGAGTGAAAGAAAGDDGDGNGGEGPAAPFAVHHRLIWLSWTHSLEA